MTYRTISVELVGPVAWIRITAPVVDSGLLAELGRAAEATGDGDGIVVAVLSDEGGALAAGWRGDEIPAYFRALELMPQPVIACVEDGASGAGLEIALQCDLRIAGEDAVFSMPQVAAGNVPSLGGTQRLPRIAGRTAAAAMLLLGEELTADAALRCGLVNDVVARGGAAARAGEIAARIAEQGPLAVRYAKEAIRQGLDMPLEQALRYETDLTIILQTTADRDEGVRAFLEKRKPRFQGK